MIKLIVTSDSYETQVYDFNRPSIIIGGKDSGADVPLFLDRPLEKAVQVFTQSIDGKLYFFVARLANNPAITLNGLPFGKQPLFRHDLLKIGQFAIRLDTEFPKNSPFQMKEESEMTENGDVETLIQAEPLSKNLVDELAHLDSSTQDDSAFSAHPHYSKKQDQHHEYSSKPTLKDFYLSEYDDDGESNPLLGLPHQKDTIGIQTTKSWFLLFKIFSFLLSIVALTIGLVYLWVSDQSGEDEIQASKAIADVAMALTYAQIKHIQPQNQNWSDPEFIRNNLTAVIASEYTPLAEFDVHGTFANSQYMLRIYTSSDLSQFLVIAQPAPSLLQWFIPKASIIIDSHAMEMRRIMDLKALNRLLVHANTLDSANAREVSHLVQQGELIPIAQLVNKKENEGFSPPKALALIRPNAENFIYNAPRYYSLGQAIIKKSIEAYEKRVNEEEITMVKQELALFSQYPNLVLYSSEGIQHATHAQRALYSIAPKEKFLIAYLQLNSKGKISNAHLLMDDPSLDNVALNIPLEKQVAKKENISRMEVDNLEWQTINLLFPEGVNEKFDIVDQQHPVFLELKALADSRNRALQPINDKMVNLLNLHTHAPVADFYAEFNDLREKYLQVTQEHSIKIVARLKDIAREHSYISAHDFIEYAHAAQLDAYLKDFFDSLKHKNAMPESINETITEHLSSLENSLSWADLEKHALQLSELLQFEKISDQDKLIALQNAAQLQSLKKINQFLLSSQQEAPADLFGEKQRKMLMNTLWAIWITDPDTFDFYLAEFDLHAAANKQGKSNTP